MIVIRRGRPRDRGSRLPEIDDLMRALVAPAGRAQHPSGGVWRPPIDVYQQPDRVTIVAEIAGMDGEEIDIVVEGDVVSIRGHRLDPCGTDHRTFHQAQIAFGDFGAEVYVPVSIDNDKASATYENGFLTVHLPRVQGRTVVATTPEHRGSSARSDA